MSLDIPTHGAENQGLKAGTKVSPITEIYTEAVDLVQHPFSYARLPIPSRISD